MFKWVDLILIWFPNFPGNMFLFNSLNRHWHHIKFQNNSISCIQWKSICIFSSATEFFGFLFNLLEIFLRLCGYIYWNFVSIYQNSNAWLSIPSILWSRLHIFFTFLVESLEKSEIIHLLLKISSKMWMKRSASQLYFIVA